MKYMYIHHTVIEYMYTSQDIEHTLQDIAQTSQDVECTL